jgi:hypothetical protein
MVGGGTRQAGVLAAAGLVALSDGPDGMIDRLAEDHANARRLADALSGMDGIVSAGGTTHGSSFEPIAANMVALCKLYADQGFAATDYVPAAFIGQGSEFAIADLCWTLPRTGGQAPWRFHTTYNLARTPAGWRIRPCTAYQEQPLDA